MFVKERFFQKIREDGCGCHLWTGARNIWGYGRHKIDGKTCSAHRTAWALVNGPVPVGLLVLHRCDNPQCVNPVHLYVGTQADNVRDMLARNPLYANRPPATAEPKIAKSTAPSEPIVRGWPIISARISVGLRAALEVEAAQMGTSISTVVRAAVLDLLEARAVERMHNEIAEF